MISTLMPKSIQLLPCNTNFSFSLEFLLKTDCFSDPSVNRHTFLCRYLWIKHGFISHNLLSYLRNRCSNAADNRSRVCVGES